MQATAALASIAPLSTSDLLVLFHSAAAEAYAEMKEEQDKQDTFAIYSDGSNPTHVLVVEFCGDEVLICFEDGAEEYVPYSKLEFLD